LLSGDTTAANAGPPFESVETIWQRFRTNDPSAFAVSAKDIVNWHEFQAQDSERQTQWFAAAFHLQRLLTLRPDDVSLTQRLTRAKEHLR
jgi:hypothetical protein